ncbi:MAG: VPLPA-CTERM sorting domain-containing protein [Candidatus Limnocylindria bacterium]
MVPEPASATLMGVAMAALAAARRRGRRAAPS